MLQLRGMRLQRTGFELVAAGVTISEEGVALCYVKEGGVTKVAPSTGAAGELFAGLPIMRNIPPAYVPVVETVTVKADGKFELLHAPAEKQFLVKLGAAPLTPTDDAPDTAVEVRISGNVGEVVVANAGKKLTVQYMYVPTVLEARTFIGDAPYGGIVANQLGTVGVIKHAQRVSTSFFDASADWADALHAKLGAGGRFVPAKASEAIPNLIVKNTPSEGSPFLELEFNVA